MSRLTKLVLELLKQWDWGLFLLILLYMALPQLYRSYSVYLIGNAIPDVNTWKITLRKVLIVVSVVNLD